MFYADHALSYWIRGAHHIDNDWWSPDKLLSKISVPSSDNYMYIAYNYIDMAITPLFREIGNKRTSHLSVLTVLTTFIDSAPIAYLSTNNSTSWTWISESSMQASALAVFWEVSILCAIISYRALHAACASSVYLLASKGIYFGCLCINAETRRLLRAVPGKPTAFAGHGTGVTALHYAIP